MKLVLDTNVFCANYRMTGAGFRVLRDGLHLVPADLKVPEVVLDEVENRFEEDLLDGIEAVGKARNKMRRVIPTWEPPAIGPDEAATLAGEYRTWLEAELASMGAEVLPYPEVPHKKVVVRDLARRSPFRRTGSGYRDYLIWESVRRLTYAGQDRIVLLTANKADFGDGELADELKADLLNDTDVELVLGLREFNDTYIVPKLSMAEEIRQLLQDKAGTAFDIPTWIHENLIEILRDEPGLEFYVLGFPDGVGSVWPHTIIDFKQVEIDPVLNLTDDRVVIKATVTARLDFSVDIDWDDYVKNQEVRDYLGDSEPFHSAWTDEAATLTLGFSFVLDNQAKDLIESELGFIESDYASADWSSW